MSSTGPAHEARARGARLSGPGYLALLLFGVVSLGVLSAFSLMSGAAEISAGEVTAAIRSLFGGEESGASSVAEQIVVQLRLPRLVGGLVAGGVLATVGSTLQSVMKNPLADPYILGISSGASVGVALVVVLGISEIGGPLASFAGFSTAVLSVWVVHRVAYVDGLVPPVRLLLAGVALSSFATALTGVILYLAPEATQVRGVIFWLMGGLGGSDWRGAGWTTAIALPACAFLFASARWQNLLLLGDEAALTLGLDVATARGWLVAIAALATGAVVAFSGSVGFVGLIVPHALRPFVGPDHRRLIPAAFVFGGALLVTMDLLARLLIAPEELPVGLLTGLLGAPFFMLLLRKTKGSGEG